MESIQRLWKEWEIEGASILVVDDEEDSALVTAVCLRRAGAGQVWTATTMEEAERLYIVERPELAVIDYHMPPGRASTRSPPCARSSVSRKSSRWSC